MTQAAQVKDLVQQLQEQDANKEIVLEQLSKFGGKAFDPDIVESLKGNNILSVLAKAITDHYNEWHRNFPVWIAWLSDFLFNYRASESFSYDQSSELVAAYRKYLLNECWTVLCGFKYYTGWTHARQILLQENEIYNSLKKAIDFPDAIDCFKNFVAGFDPWRQKILEDKDFVVRISTCQARESFVWNTLNSLALHPDAKVLMPNEVVVLAGKTKIVDAINLYALLCNENDLASLALEPSYIEALENSLEEILNTGKTLLDGIPRLLPSLLRPIANISTADSYKDVFGKKMVVNLLRIVCDTLPDTFVVMTNLTQSRAIASKTLWNLAYLKANCTRIQEAKGIERLTATKETTNDPDIKCNIEGILHMCNAALQTTNEIKNEASTGQVTGMVQVTGDTSATAVATKKGHVMISYNWANQPIVKQIAQSLKDHGYNVWLDIEQMGGSTLEAMALAIEQSEMVLICMSQKYKDSPNCRLEGEYCVNKKVPFVPLMMQKGYSPDGWLGITLGSKLWYDFTNDNEWDVKMRGLTKAIGNHGKNSKSNTAVEQHATPAAQGNSPKAKAWTAEDMLNWMRIEDIEQPEELLELLRKHKVNHKALNELKYLLTDPQAFTKFNNFQSICKEMGIGEIGMALQLAAAIRKL